MTPAQPPPPPQTHGPAPSPPLHNSPSCSSLPPRHCCSRCCVPPSPTQPPPRSPPSRPLPTLWGAAPQCNACAASSPACLRCPARSSGCSSPSALGGRWSSGCGAPSWAPWRRRGALGRWWHLLTRTGRVTQAGCGSLCCLRRCSTATSSPLVRLTARGGWHAHWHTSQRRV